MCEIGKKFSDIQYYNKEMQKGMEDKLFFIDKLPNNQKYAFVDFGCADGSMINALTSIFERSYHKYIGYDISDTMINIAKTNYHGPVNANVIFTSKWDDVKKELEWTNICTEYKSVLILSSVIHEVYSYAKDQNDINIFWDRVLNSNFDYIIIRDMCPSEDIEQRSDIHIEDKIRDKSKNKIDNKYLSEFENEWGKIYNKRNLIHFLLKYRWKVNWERELHENYFPITIQNLLKYFKDFNIDYFERFKVPFLEKCWKEDFDVEINDYTHIKAIFTKKK